MIRPMPPYSAPYSFLTDDAHRAYRRRLRRRILVRSLLIRATTAFLVVNVILFAIWLVRS